MKNIVGWAIVMALLGLLWFLLSPQTFLRPTTAGEKDQRGADLSTPKPPAVASLPTKNATKSGQRTPADAVDAQFETGSGREVPGEKLARFSSQKDYRMFLATAPPGTILGQIDALNAVRVKADSSLGSALTVSGGTVSGNFYVRIPEVPLEVREKGDTMYRAVGRKALDLIGADGVEEAWGQGVKVALMDTPVEGVEKVSGETAGHGTAMRSLIQGQSTSGRGAAPGAEVLAFAVLDQDGKGNSFRLAEAIVKAVDQGVRVINMSLGSDGDSPVVRDAVNYALAKNVVLVAAAGNEAVNRVNYPAAYQGVLAVASVDAARNHLYFSNRGKAVDLAAPGFAVAADWPGGKPAQVTGTSASTALVSGALAALLSREPALTGRQAANLMTQYADATGLPGADEEVGSGVINLQRVLERNQRGIVDVALGGVALKEDGPQARLQVGVQNRGTETVNSPSLEIQAGGERRKFFFGSLAPGQTGMESINLDLVRARQQGGIGVEAEVGVRGDLRKDNNSWAGFFRIPPSP